MRVRPQTSAFPEISYGPLRLTKEKTGQKKQFQQDPQATAQENTLESQIQITPMDNTKSERLHTKDNDPLQIEVPKSAYKTHSYLQAKIGHKANQTRATKPTTSPLPAVQDFKVFELRRQVFDRSGRLWDCTVFSITFAAYSSEYKRYSTTYCLLCSLVEHSCINPKSLTFGYLDEKPIDIGLMKFPALPLCFGTWSLPLHSPPPRPLLRPMLSLHESKRSMTPWKSRFCDTMVLPSP
ncbi:hypothetical protein BHE74_00046993 [Ensete ventricosum]|nr:hypothetical protein BHE74_00046993 [Ensete ventricosum]